MRDDLGLDLAHGNLPIFVTTKFTKKNALDPIATYMGAHRGRGGSAKVDD
jgi:hypothetical protein